MGTSDEKDRNGPAVSGHGPVKQETVEDATHFRRDGRRLYFSGWFSPYASSGGLLPSSWNHPLPGYIVAVLAQWMLFALLQFILRHWSTLHFPAIFPLVAVLLIACGWGMGPAIVATVWGAILFVVFPLSPNRVLSITSPSDLVSLLCYIGVGGGISYVIEQLVRARIKAEAISNQFEATFEAISDGISIYDREGKILRINKAGRDIFVVQEKPEFTSMSLSERLNLLKLRNEQGELLTPEQWPQARILRGEVLTGMNTIAQRLDNQDVHLAISGAPICDEKGQIHGAVCITRDETERRTLEQRAHEALKALLRMAEALIELPTQEEQTAGTAEQAARLVDVQGRSMVQRLVELIRSILGCTRVSITTVDSQTQALISTAVVGISPEHEQQWKARQPGFSLSELFASSFIGKHLQANEAIVVDTRQPPWRERPNPFGIVTALLVPMSIGGRLIGVLALDYGVQAHVYTQEERQLAKAVAEMAALVLEREKLFQERAEARASEISLRETNRLMDEFIGIAGHELRTPLATIKASVQLALRNLQRLPQTEHSYTGEELALRLQPIRQILERAEQQISMQNRLIHDLLDVSRVQTNKLDLHLRHLDILKLMRELIENQRLLEPSREILLKCEIVGEVTVRADGDRLGQVVMNLLSNALKYSEVDTPVEVSLELQGKEIQVQVRDQGPGLPPDKQKRIWERFYRVPGIETKSGSGIGLGLGLHISRTLIELHGGKIGVKSAPGQGSTFWFTLPLVGARSALTHGA